jgi:heme a synthase
MRSRFLIFTVLLAVILALFVVMLGAYTRLTDAGLGCPDWPGCYGHLVLPNAEKELTSAQLQYPDLPIEGRKAWTEMAHRYAAGTLALLIFFIGGYAFWRQISWKLPRALILLVIFQAALGMWTVTMKLLPIVVMGHLLGGSLIFSTLSCLRLQLSTVSPQPQPWQRWVVLGVVIVFCQIALGGWVSANYAGIACVGFPQCNGQWLPTLHFAQGFNLFSPLGTNYQGGMLDNEARVTIQVIHRLGAIITAAYILSLSLFLLIKVNNKPIRLAAGFAALLVVIQFSLGIMNVIYLLPIGVAVAHNGVAALLMATMLMMVYLTHGRLQHAS